MTEQEKEGQGVQDVSEAARSLAARRRIVDGVCEVCGTPFTGTSKRRYCSHKCAQAAYMAARKQRQGRKGRGEEGETGAENESSSHIADEGHITRHKQSKREEIKP